jgi:hypothetical protein
MDFGNPVSMPAGLAPHPEILKDIFKSIKDIFFNAPILDNS